jgi:hypothetical protein
MPPLCEGSPQSLNARALGIEFYSMENERGEVRNSFTDCGSCK